ncbi:MAG: DUF378 domain-containing protein [Nanoarchaeota archaeon]|nr:DUF378 domain-containing protein [Nanoarchaeota archaeon]
MNKSPLNLAVAVLLIVGGLNWGLVGLLNMNIVETVLGSMPVAVTAVYGLVGLAAVYKLLKLVGVVK